MYEKVQQALRANVNSEAKLFAVAVILCGTNKNNVVMEWLGWPSSQVSRAAKNGGRDLVCKLLESCSEVVSKPLVTCSKPVSNLLANDGFDEYGINIIDSIYNIKNNTEEILRIIQDGGNAKRERPSSKPKAAEKEKREPNIPTYDQVLAYAKTLYPNPELAAYLAQYFFSSNEEKRWYRNDGKEPVLNWKSYWGKWSFTSKIQEFAALSRLGQTPGIVAPQEPRYTRKEIEDGAHWMLEYLQDGLKVATPDHFHYEQMYGPFIRALDKCDPGTLPKGYEMKDGRVQLKSNGFVR